MKHHLSSLHHATLTALSGIGQVLRQPRYAAGALVSALGFAWLIFLLTNGGFYGALLMSRLPLIDKLGVIGTMFIEIARQAATSLTGALLVLVSILQSISLALIIFTARHNKRNQQTTQQLGLSSIASIAAAIGLGCVPCGTSLILPIVAVFFSGAAAASAATVASTIVLIIALGLSLFSLYRSGQIAAIYITLAQQEEHHAVTTNRG
ncbi:MAG: hypothetical protein D8B38_02045 [Candidatus Saccharimonas sp.]|nr:MAG: hypothetical protein D8B38_02045 [Candidatus Saccharimonas sp.]